MKKNGFFTFCFSFIPGAGEMYLGMMFTGTLIMAAFWGTVALAGFFGLNFLLIILPVLWFYSFFNVHNIKNIPYEERISNDTKLKENCLDYVIKDNKNILNKRHLVFGTLLILGGLYILTENVLYRYFSEIYWLRRLFDSLPTLVVSLLIILLGIYLIKGKKTNDDITLYSEKRDDINE